MYKRRSEKKILNQKSIWDLKKLREGRAPPKYILFNKMYEKKSASIFTGMIMKKSTQNTNSEELDITSSHFNPARALNEKVEKIIGLKPNSPIYDNLSCFVQTEKGIFPRERKFPVARTNVLKPTISSAAQTVCRQQEDTSQRTRKKIKNVLTRMETIKGPLGFLKKCMDEKLRIKVDIRGAIRVRGSCTGFVEAFDRHCNLVLMDVSESWTRQKRRVGKLFGSVGPNTREEPCEKAAQEDENNQLTSRRRCGTSRKDIREDRKTETDQRRKPKIIVRKREKRKITYERHLDQILIRGEQIVTVKQLSI